MAKEDKFADELLNDEELDGVAGGNARECFHISMSISDNSKLREQFKGSYEDTDYLKSFLHDKLGVDAEFNMNEGNYFEGTPNLNKYKDATTGKSMSHNEVMHRIALYGFPDLIL